VRSIALAGLVAAIIAASAWAAPSRSELTFDAPVSGLAIERGSLWVSIAGDDLVLRLDLRTGRRLARIVLPHADRRAFGGGSLASGRRWIWISAPVRVIDDPSVGDASGWIGRLDPRSLRLRLTQVHGDRPAYVGVGSAGVWTSGHHTLRRVDPGSGKVTGRVHFRRFVALRARLRPARRRRRTGLVHRRGDEQPAADLGPLKTGSDEFIAAFQSEWRRKTNRC
jgi:hypothetical protein